MAVLCPLSGSFAVKLVERLAVSDLAWLYRRYLHMDIVGQVSRDTEIGLYHSCVSDLCFFHPVLAAPPTLYDELQERFDWYYPDEKDEYRYAAELVEPDHAVLEVGCGRGQFARIIHPAEYVGLEFSPAAAAAAISRGLTVSRASIEEHAQARAEHYDLVCAFQVLEHVAQPDSFIASCLACLKPGGLLIYSVPNAASFVTLVPNNIWNLPPHHLTWWSPASLAFVAERFALDLVETRTEALADAHRLWYARTVAMESLRSLTHSGFRLIDHSLRFRALFKIASAMGRLLEGAFHDERLCPVGHSLTAVYRKPRVG